METNLLERKDSIAVLRIIATDPGCTQGAVIGRKGDKDRTKLLRLEELVDAGLVESSPSEYRGRPSKTYRLTQRGEMLLQIIQMIDKL